MQMYKALKKQAVTRRKYMYLLDSSINWAWCWKMDLFIQFLYSGNILGDCN